MIVTLSGITGTGKSFFKDAISKELGFKNLVIVTTRKPRNGEKAGIDKEFVSDKKFDKMVKENIITANFEFLGAKYGYRKELLESDINQVTEVHYSTIYDIKEHALNMFSIYIKPNDINRAKQELKKRLLPTKIEQARLNEIDEHILEYSQNADLRKQFDLEFVNDYTEKSLKELLDIIRKKCLQRKIKENIEII